MLKREGISLKYKSKQIYCATFILLLNATIGTILAGGANVSKVGFQGWTEVSKRWPGLQGGYFIAVEKYHHFIEVKLPPGLEGSLNVQLDYFYNYAEVRPTIEIVPCNKRENVISNTTIQKEGVWLTHKASILARDCAKRNDLTYHVILHNAGDVFAWNRMSIVSSDEKEGAGLTEATTTKNVPAETEKPSVPPSDEASPTENTRADQASVDDSSTVAPQTQADTIPEPDRPIVGDSETETGDAPKEESVLPADKETGASTVRPETNTLETAITSTTKTDTTSPTTVPLEDDDKKNEVETQISQTRSRQNQPSRKLRKRRFAGQFDQEAGTSGTNYNTGDRTDTRADGTRRISISCQPETCDRNLFKYARFITMPKGLPPDVSNLQTNTMVLNTKNAPLKIQLDSAHESFADVDACLKFALFMDPGTNLDLKLRDKNPNAQAQHLETITRSTKDSSASKWEQFSRCISDYMPRYEPRGPEKHSIEFELVPRADPGGKRIAIAYDKSRSVELREPYELAKFIPNVVTLDDVAKVSDYWVLDKDGVVKPTLKFQKGTYLSLQGEAERKELAISNIDPKQKTFDIVSRWIKPEDIETAENPIMLVYKAKRPDWVQGIEIGYQPKSWPVEKWRDQEVFKAPPVGTNQTQTGDEAANELTLPIKLKNLSSEEFRLRVRHHLRTPSVSDYQAKSLSVSSLAFADVCAADTFCLNGGECQPTGTATARCECKQGYSGAHCEIKSACDVVLNQETGYTGRQLCQMMGADCVENLPVLRCKWPDDEYFECTARYQSGADTGSATARPVAVLSPDGDLEALRKKAESQMRYIIILGVFMASLLIFAVVIIINMLQRLQKSKRRLERTQSEVHELSRRSLPSTSGGFRPSSTGRGKPAAVIAYSNNAFDVE